MKVYQKPTTIVNDFVLSHVMQGTNGVLKEIKDGGGGFTDPE